MNIIQHGDEYEVLEPKIFQCTYCGCIFVATACEYDYDQSSHLPYVTCPEPYCQETRIYNELKNPKIVDAISKWEHFDLPT